MIIDQNTADAEYKLAFEVDPKRDYMAEVDAFVPPWTADRFKEVDGSSAAWTELSVSEAVIRDTPRYVVSGNDLVAVPHMRYERAIDPSGFICAVMISTTRPGPGRMHGFDGLGTESRVRSEKQNMGWLWLERGASHRGRTGAEYFAWAMAVKDKRQKAYEAQQADDARAFMSQAARVAEAQAINQSKSNAELVKEVLSAFLELQAVPKGKRGKEEAA